MSRIEQRDFVRKLCIILQRLDVMYLNSDSTKPYTGSIEELFSCLCKYWRRCGNNN